MERLQAILTARLEQILAARLEQILAAQLDAALDSALDMALDRLLGAETTEPKPKAKAKASKKPQAPAEQAVSRVRAEPTPQYPASYEQFAQMVASAALGQSKSGKELGALWANRASALRKHYEEHGIPVPWGKLWALVAQDAHLPTRAEGSARAIARALGLPA